MTPQKAMSELLDALGFEQMSKDVLTENDKDRLFRYARIIIKNSRPEHKRRAIELLRCFGLA